MEKTRFTISPCPALCLGRRVGRVVAQAAVGLGARQPGAVLVLGRGDQPAAHLVVADAAVLRAADLVAARLLRLEPEARGAARDGVDLRAQVRQVEGMHDVLRAQLHVDRAPDRDVQLVQRDDVVGRREAPVGAGGPEGPRPLARGDLDAQGVRVAIGVSPEALAQVGRRAHRQRSTRGPRVLRQSAQSGARGVGALRQRQGQSVPIEGPVSVL